MEYVRAVASSNDRTAFYAVVALVDEANEGGLSGNPVEQRREAEAILRELYEKDRVTDPRAKVPLIQFAHAMKWPR